MEKAFQLTEAFMAAEKVGPWGRGHRNVGPPVPTRLWVEATSKKTDEAKSSNRAAKGIEPREVTCYRCGALEHIGTTKISDEISSDSPNEAWETSRVVNISNGMLSSPL